jgi:hypothetical protein
MVMTVDAAVSDALVSIVSGVASIVIPIIGLYATKALQSFAKKRGIEIDQQRLQRIDQFLVNGLNLAASNAGSLRHLPNGISAKAYIAQGALNYLREHGAETLNEMSASLNDSKVQEAMRARIETLITDPTKPTPAILSPDKTPTVVAPVTASS